MMKSLLTYEAGQVLNAVGFKGGVTGDGWVWVWTLPVLANLVVLLALKPIDENVNQAFRDSRESRIAYLYKRMRPIPFSKYSLRPARISSNNVSSLSPGVRFGRSLFS